jgi:RND family efflux transporter MFP subunit
MAAGAPVVVPNCRPIVELLPNLPMQHLMPIAPTRRRKFLPRLALLLAAAAVPAIALTVEPTAAVAATAAGQDEVVTVKALSHPDEELQLSFPTRGRVGEVNVKSGETVKAGQVLMRLDDRRERAQYEMAKMEVEVAGPTKIKLREDQVSLARNEFDRKQDNPSFTTAEKEEAQMKLAEATTQLELERVNTELKTAEMGIAKATLGMMEIKSPIDGVVRKVELGVGEAVTEQSAALTVVSIDPLEIRVQTLEPDQVALLRIGQKMQVRYATGQGVDQGWRDATITYIDPMVEGGSQRHRVNLELPNPDGIAPGREMELRLPLELAELSDRANRRFR